MKERPIIFNGEMVRAILEGRKTQTRRVIKVPRGYEVHDRNRLGTITSVHPKKGKFGIFITNEHPTFPYTDLVPCPYGQAGDRLWVREAWCQDGRGGKESNGEDAVYYRADFPNPNVWKGFWKPSIHMPRWASRITLEVKSVRVERVQDIEGEDCLAEGVGCNNPDHGLIYALPGDVGRLGCPVCGHDPSGYAIREFKNLWDSINEKRGYGWDANPWVWVVEFERVEQ